MADFMAGWPFPAVVVGLFVVVMLRANATYWLGRAAQRGVRRTRAERLLRSPGFRRAERVVGRWGAPVISLSFLTVGFQTLANFAAGVTRMPLRRYLPAVTVGGVLWAFLYATVGFVTFRAWGLLWDRSPVAAVVISAVIFAVLVVFVVRNVQDRRSNPTPHEENDDADEPAATGEPEPLSWQLTIDANDPHRLADFWAAALQAQVEDNTALIEELLGKGWIDDADTLVHRGRRSWTDLVAVQGTGPRILFQRVPEQKAVKNRLHLDLNVGGERLNEEVARLVALGAVQGKEWKDPSGHWFVMHDPEGNEFCVQ